MKTLYKCMTRQDNSALIHHHPDQLCIATVRDPDQVHIHTAHYPDQLHFITAHDPGSTTDYSHTIHNPCSMPTNYTSSQHISQSLLDADQHVPGMYQQAAWGKNTEHYASTRQAKYIAHAPAIHCMSTSKKHSTLQNH
jgi:hypothetical protein